MQLFSKTHLKSSRGGDTVSALGVETLVNSGSRSVNSAHDSRFFTHSHSHCIFAGLRERSGVIRTGTTVYVFLTPDQARFFCVRRKTQEEHNKKRSVNRRPERCAHKLYSRPARRSFSRSAKPFGPDETNEIHMIPLTIQISVENDKQSGEMRNNIKRFQARRIPGVTPAAAPRQKPASSAPVPAAPPWARKEEGK